MWLLALGTVQRLLLKYNTANLSHTFPMIVATSAFIGIFFIDAIIALIRSTNLSVTIQLESLLLYHFSLCQSLQYDGH